MLAIVRLLASAPAYLVRNNGGPTDKSSRAE
jgi:hypothetical protein